MTRPPVLPADLDLEAYLDANADAGDETRAFLVSHVTVENPDRERWLSRLGRVAERYSYELRDLDLYERAIRDDIAAQRAYWQSRLAVLNDVIREAAEDQRRADPERKSLHIPGVGRWQTREVPASWRTEDEVTAVGALPADEIARLTSRRMVIDVDKDGLKRYLDEQGVAEWPGMVRTERHLSTKGPFDA